MDQDWSRERRHGLRVSRTGRSFLVMLTSLSAQRLESCEPLLSVGEYTTMGGVTVLYGDKGFLFHKGSNVAKKIDAWIQKDERFTILRLCSCVQREQSVQHLHETERKQG